MHQRGRRHIGDVEQRDDGVDARVGLRHHEKASAVEQQLMASVGYVELRCHLCARDVDDAHSVLRGDEHVRAVGLDDVALIDADLLGVGSREVRCRRSRRRHGSACRGIHCRHGGARILHHRPAAVAVPRPAAQAPRSHSLQRFGLHVREEVGAFGEEPQPRRTHRRELCRPGRAGGRRRRAGRCRIGCRIGGGRWWSAQSPCAQSAHHGRPSNQQGSGSPRRQRRLRWEVCASCRFRRCDEASWFPSNSRRTPTSDAM